MVLENAIPRSSASATPGAARASSGEQGRTWKITENASGSAAARGASASGSTAASSLQPSMVNSSAPARSGALVQSREAG